MAEREHRGDVDKNTSSGNADAMGVTTITASSIVASLLRQPRANPEHATYRAIGCALVDGAATPAPAGCGRHLVTGARRQFPAGAMAAALPAASSIGGSGCSGEAAS
jgi:hypothetical protein